MRRVTQTDGITIFHGATSPDAIQKCREACPQATHGWGYAPVKYTERDDGPYFLDNGAFSAWQNGNPWDNEAFQSMLYEVMRWPNNPEFVVLPDVVADPKATYGRTETWYVWLTDHGFDFPFYVAAQDGMRPDRLARWTRDLGADGIFIGGTERWKRSHAEDFVDAGHQHDLAVHLARPGLNRLGWAYRTGADSMDTTSVVQNGEYRTLRLLDQLITEEVAPEPDGGRQKMLDANTRAEGY